jgi:hypothetical protein
MIKVDGVSYELNPNLEQIDASGRKFRLSGISLVTTKQAVWVSELKSYRHGTVYSFRYLDKDSEFFGFEFDAHGKFVCKTTDT